MQRKYEVSITIDSKVVRIQDVAAPNYEGGEAKLMAHLFYRAMLASGFTPNLACISLGRVAAAGGYSNEASAAVGKDPAALSEGA
jgi:hypothetical protein